MNHWRKMVCAVLAACSLSAVCVAGAVEPTNPAAAAEVQGSAIVPMSNYLALIQQLPTIR